MITEKDIEDAIRFGQLYHNLNLTGEVTKIMKEFQQKYLRPVQRYYTYRCNDSLSDTGHVLVIILADDEHQAQNLVNQHLHSLDRADLIQGIQLTDVLEQHISHGVIYTNVERNTDARGNTANEDW
jgi:hypothetical protein